MTNKTLTRVHRVVHLLLSLSLVIAGGCLIAGCLSIYQSGAYSREAVADTFAVIAIPVYLCLGLTVLGLAVDLALPLPRKVPATTPDRPHLLARMHAKKDLSGDAALRTAVQTEQNRRRCLVLLRTIVLTAASIVFLVYALNASHYDTADINTSMIRAMTVLIPCLAVALGVSVFTAYRLENSIKRELALLKNAPDASSPDAGAASARSQTVRHVAVAVLLVVAVAAMLYGFFAGGTADVLTKAINICTECIGLG